MNELVKVTERQVWNTLSDRARRILSSVTMTDEIPTDGTNPIWLALTGLSQVSGEDVQDLIDRGEMSQEEGNAFLEAMGQASTYTERLRPLIWKGKTSNKNPIMEAYSACQTMALNTAEGPIGNGSLASIRQRWYASKLPKAMGWKFAAQALEQYLIKDADVVLVSSDGHHAFARKTRNKKTVAVFFKNEWTKTKAERWKEDHGHNPRIHTISTNGWGRAYAQLQSQTFVQQVLGGLLYRELWIEDVSRKHEGYGVFWNDFYAILALEKEGEYPHFQGICRAAGIPVLLAMSGNSSFASVENVLYKHFWNTWDKCWKPTTDKPLRFIVLSDWDDSGMGSVQEGAFSQVQRYLGDACKLVRLGINPEQILDSGRSIPQAGYEYEADKNEGTARWSYEHGHWTSGDEVDVDNYLDEEDRGYLAWAKAKYQSGSVCYGIEVEALEPEEYTGYLAELVVNEIGGEDEMRKQIAEKAQPSWYTVQQETTEVHDYLNIHQALVQIEDWVRQQKYDVERTIDNAAARWIGDENDDEAFRNQEDVKQSIADAVEEVMEHVSTEDFAKSIKRGDDRYTPVTREQANAVAIKKFYDTFTKAPYKWAVKMLGAELYINWDGELGALKDAMLLDEEEREDIDINFYPWRVAWHKVVEPLPPSYYVMKDGDTNYFVDEYGSWRYGLERAKKYQSPEADYVPDTAVWVKVLPDVDNIEHLLTILNTKWTPLLNALQQSEANHLGEHGLAFSFEEHNLADLGKDDS